MSKLSVPMGKRRKSNVQNKEKEPKEIAQKNDTKIDRISRVFYGWMSKKKEGTPLKLRVHHFVIQGMICEGTFGKILMARNMRTGLTAAAKVEAINTHSPQLHTEYHIYEKLGSDKPGFVKIYYYGPCDKNLYNILIMELLGPDLDDLFVSCNGLFSHKTVLMIALQTLRMMQYIHSRHIIYRDVKPENFCIGNIIFHKEKIIHIVDFGLSKIQDGLDKSDKKDIFQINYLIGTARYMSINAHNALDQSARDDLESLGYMYIYFLKGRLPWMGMSRVGCVEDQYRGIGKMKGDIKPHELIGEYPEFVEYLKYVRKLKYNEKPNYDFLINLMSHSIDVMGYKKDNIYDWTEIMNERYLTGALSVDPDS